MLCAGPCLLFTFFPININIDFVINLLFSNKYIYITIIIHLVPQIRLTKKKKNECTYTHYTHGRTER